MDGQTLIKQLSLYNGTVPIKKEPIIATLNEIVEAINFLAEHGVSDGTQLENLENKLMQVMEEAQLSLDKIDEKLLKLSQVSKYLLALEPEQPEDRSNAEKYLNEMDVASDLTFDDIKLELQSEKASRKILKEKLDDAIEDFNIYNGIKKVGQDTEKKEDEKSRSL
nr:MULTISPECIES: helical hairpin domain-containing protein [unclassified Lactococcus]